MTKRHVPPELARANWDALCRLAGIPTDNTLTAAEILERLRAQGHARWGERQIQQWIEDIEEVDA